jgi:NADH-quinone oxidoreductase subunit N
MTGMTAMREDPGAIIPEILLIAGAIASLLIGLFLPRRRQWLIAVLAAAVLVAAIAAGAVAATRPARVVFGQSYAIDTVLGAGRLIVLTAALTLCLSVEQVRGHKRETEYFVLVLLGTLGVIVLTGASDLLLLVAGYLLASVPLYALTAFAKDTLGTEAALKYYLIGALAGIVMLFDVMVLYGLGSATGYAALGPGLEGAAPAALAVAITAVLAGLSFKLGAVPVHFWVPDITAGAPLPVATFVTTVPKIGGLLAAYRLLDLVIPTTRVDWPLLVAVVATASMTLGNLAAFWQTSPRRLLAYPTISQVGYLLIGVAAAPASDLALRGVLFYAAAYAATNLGAFAVVLELPRPPPRRLRRPGPPPAPARARPHHLPARLHRHPHRHLRRQAQPLRRRDRQRPGLAGDRGDRGDRQHRRQRLLLPALARPHLPAPTRRGRDAGPRRRLDPRWRLHRRRHLPAARPAQRHRPVLDPQPADQPLTSELSYRPRRRTGPRRPGRRPATHDRWRQAH